MQKELKMFFYYFIGWRLLLFLILFIALMYIPLQKDFLGGGMANYLKNPYLWSWVNFDGEHYLSIASHGYQPLTYFFFPLYPILISLGSKLVGSSLTGYVVSGLLISNISFFLALIGFWKLVKLDFKKNIARLAVFLLLIFPTAFYFGSFYTEGLFLALVIWSFYFARKGNWIAAGVLGGLSTATRITGLALLPALIIEALLQGKKDTFKKVVGVLLIPVGLLAYIYYQKVATGDPLEFFNSVGIFGQQREAGFVLLPQVFYRYIFKIIPNLNFSYLPGVFTTFLEFISAFLFLLFVILSFFKQRLSYAMYSLAAYLIPTFSGSFSSLPRYVLIIFPAFILASQYLSKQKKKVVFLIFLFLGILLTIATAMFTRGYWIS